LGTSSPTFTNVTFWDNSANSYGGAVQIWGITGHSNPRFKNVTLAQNSATFGGAISARGLDGDSRPVFTNTILWGNTAWIEGPQMTVYGAAVPTIAYSVVEGGDAGLHGSTAFSSGKHNTADDPQLTDLDDYGGNTEVALLMAGSSAINKGKDLGCPTKDQRGVKRPQGTHCDIGAAEVQYKSFKSQGALDGWVAEMAPEDNYGGKMNWVASTFLLGDDEQNRAYRGILSFNTATLPDSATPYSALLKGKEVGGPKDWPLGSSLLVGATADHIGSIPALEQEDFAATLSPEFPLEFLSSPINGWYAGIVHADVADQINVLGLTQMRLRFNPDDDGDTLADLLEFWSGNADPARRPQITIYYY
jgi:predicted outer membrane repeat protein